MSNTGMDLAPMIGQIVPHTFNPGYIVLSYVVSVVGSWTALELINKRTSTRGLYNWYLLLAAATSAGAVAIWSMHYIGNRAIKLGDGSRKLQIEYNPGFTAGSFFLPIVVITMSFFVFNIKEDVNIPWTVTGGTMSGLAICGMHYLGLGGTANYSPVVAWKYVLGSAIIAIVASTLALGIFFYLKSIWTNSWWKRASCALLLAVAVSGSHWIATAGTDYRFKADTGGASTGLSEHATVVVVLVLAISCCFGLLCLALIGQRQRKRSAHRAQQVVLACATFDQDGRLMVTPEGLLPCRKITNCYIERSFDDVFAIDHPVFCWIFRASRCWRGVADLIPGMRSHLRMPQQVKTSRPQSANTQKDPEGVVDEAGDYSMIFKELFCVAAQDLADQIQEPLENIGVLDDRILSTGTLQRKRKIQLFLRRATPTRSNVTEIGRRLQLTIGRGQLLFIVRRTNKHETAKLQASGFCFACIHNVIETLARGMQVTTDELAPHLEDMRQHSGFESALLPGVHLACFALRPLVQRGFDVLVRKDARNLLPTSQLAVAELQQWHLNLISCMDNWTVAACLDWLRGRSEFTSRDEQEFIGHLYDGITTLADQVGNPFFGEARLSAHPLLAHCRSIDGPAQAVVFAFRVITDIHQFRTLNTQLEFCPTRFFFCQQRAYQGSPDHEIFARGAHREFSALDDHNPRRLVPNPRYSNISSSTVHPGVLTHVQGSPRASWRWPFPNRSVSSQNVTGDSSSEKNLVQATTSPVFSGTHITNEISINVNGTRSGDRSPDVELGAIAAHSEAGVGLVKQDTFAEEWMRLTIEERRLTIEERRQQR